MSSQAPQRSLAVSALWLGAAAALWAALVLILVLVVPRYERTFRYQGLPLPNPTQWAVEAGHWAVAYWYMLPLFGLFLLPVVVLLTWWLRHRVTRPLFGWIWLGALLGLPVILLLGIWLALQLP